MSLICNVVGARPNFMKIAPLVRAMQVYNVPQILVHTGQHYDANMSQVFFDELGLPKPDIYLGIGSDSHARQTARIMTAFEAVCLEHRPTQIVVVGDVNSTVAAALVAAKMHIPVAHVEAGLRSFDRTMPEELNRIVTDQLSDYLFTTEESGNKNLAREGVPSEKVHFVGNCMVDTLLSHVKIAVEQAPWTQFDILPQAYGLMTLHRVSNVDHAPTLRTLMQTANTMAEQLPLIFPMHPRTRQRLQTLDITLNPKLKLVEPLSYLTFIGLMAQARCVITDSGGIQEETTALRVPCLTLRHNTERPITIEQGSNRLVGTDPDKILSSFAEIMAGTWQKGTVPPLWDGQAADRIVRILKG